MEKISIDLEASEIEVRLGATWIAPKYIEDFMREVLETPDVWHGVTYKEDKPQVMEAIGKLKAEGLYPDVLWK